MNVSQAAQWRHNTTGFVDRQFLPHKTMKDEKSDFFCYSLPEVQGGDFLGFQALGFKWLSP